MRNKVKILLYCAGIVIACYVTQLRLFSFVLELGFKTPQTDNLWNYLVYNVPDFISIVFCFTYIIIFYRKIKQLRTTSTPKVQEESARELSEDFAPNPS
jgi:hypothetical protein